jgi:hypothetical protein
VPFQNGTVLWFCLLLLFFLKKRKWIWE